MIAQCELTHSGPVTSFRNGYLIIRVCKAASYSWAAGYRFPFKWMNEFARHSTSFTVRCLLSEFLSFLFFEQNFNIIREDWKPIYFELNSSSYESLILSIVLSLNVGFICRIWEGKTEKSVHCHGHRKNETQWIGRILIDNSITNLIIPVHGVHTFLGRQIDQLRSHSIIIISAWLRTSLEPSS